ncbi:MAG: zinc metallopeptidase, partial [Clostridiales bacterium]|nr:zinc metallopeptidase [Clostridiales bacterium]
MFDSTYIILLPAIILSLYAQHKVSSNFKKYSGVKSEKGYTGADVARMLLERNGIRTVTVSRVAGNLTDHFDPRSNNIRLSDSVYNSSSIAAVAVAAHETGHAIQHDTGYMPLSLRTNILPIASFGSNLGFWLVVLGVFLGQVSILISIGIVLFSFYVLFSILT